MFKTYIQNLSKQKQYFELLKNAFSELIEASNLEEDLFYINSLIDESTNSYISSLSKPMSFNQDMLFINENFKYIKLTYHHSLQ